LGVTSVVVTHDMRLAEKLADKVVFLHEGRVVFYGTPAEMNKSTEPIVEQFLNLDAMITDQLRRDAGGGFRRPPAGL